MTTEEHLLTLIRTSLDMHRHWCATGHVRTEHRDAMVAALTALDLLPAIGESTARADRYEAALRSIVDDPCADAGSDGYVIASEALAVEDAVITTERRGDDIAMTIDLGTSIHECVFSAADLESMTKPQLRGKISEVVERLYQETAGRPYRRLVRACDMEKAMVPHIIDPRSTEWTAPCPKFGSGESVDQRRGEPCPHCGDPRGHWPEGADQ